ncbi:(2Fe-2S)-binding protein [Methylocapsa palsarum]|uniref:Bacterioferritin-associated ferredoxin n=1 Tax=Methylocapsa palsarum TaxID=1612308 RepID=A0A1I3YQD9_9HYPH|nr:(2Fe-2S)-binding protein [Methylocapsa palsarum]SFK33426.1 Bacterioferritin-associated ferredoxin [Methylocapsa palsarum]
MIVCSCNVLSDVKIKDALGHPICPRTPGAVYKCLGCKSSCGRCLETVKIIIAESLAERESRRTPKEASCLAQAAQRMRPAALPLALQLEKSIG